MKMLIPIAAAAAIAVTAAAASAQDRTVHTTVTQRSSVHTERHDDGGSHWQTKRVCKVRWTHHRRVKRCWTTRVRY